MMLSKLHYFPMEEVKGYVILDATSTFKPHEVKLRFIGQERTLGSKSDPPMQLHSLFKASHLNGLTGKWWPRAWTKDA